MREKLGLLIVVSLLAGFLPLVFAVLVYQKSPEAGLYWVKTACTLSIVSPIVALISMLILKVSK